MRGLWALVLSWNFDSGKFVCLGLGGSGVSWDLQVNLPIDMDSA